MRLLGGLRPRALEAATALRQLRELILAETHFGATWPFFLNKVNINYIKENKLFLIYIPILIAILCVVGFFYFA